MEPSFRQRRLNLLYALSTALGLKKRGFSIPYRYADKVEAPEYPRLQELMATEEAGMLGLIDAIDTLEPAFATFGGAPPLPRFEQDWFARLACLRRLCHGHSAAAGTDCRDWFGSFDPDHGACSPLGRARNTDHQHRSGAPRGDCKARYRSPRRAVLRSALDQRRAQIGRYSVCRFKPHRHAGNRCRPLVPGVHSAPGPRRDHPYPRVSSCPSIIQSIGAGAATMSSCWLADCCMTRATGSCSAGHYANCYPEGEVAALDCRRAAIDGRCPGDQPLAA